MNTVNMRKGSTVLKVGLFCIYSAVSLFVVEPYLISAPSHTVAFVGSGIELDCISNSSGPVTWLFEPFGTGKKNWIARGNKTTSGRAICKIKTETTGQAALILEWVNLSTAGRYECEDSETSSQAAEVTVLDPTPHCNVTMQTSSEVNVKCSFSYYGNQRLELDLKKTDLWSGNCTTLHENGSVECAFGSSCNLHIPYSVSTVIDKDCYGEDKASCEWDTNFEDIYIKGTNRSIGGWHCMQQENTASENEYKDMAGVLGIIGVLMTFLGIIIVGTLLARSCGLCSTNQLISNVLSNEELAQRKKNDDGVDIYGAICDNDLYAACAVEQAALKVQDFETDDVIYTRLDQASPNYDKNYGAPAIRDGFNMSDYAEIDHTHRVLPPPPQIKFTQRQY